MGLYIITVVCSFVLVCVGTQAMENAAEKRTTPWWRVMAWVIITSFLPAGAIIAVFWWPVWRFFAERPEAYESAGAAGAGGVAIFVAVLLIVALFGFFSLFSLAKKIRSHSWGQPRR